MFAKHKEHQLSKEHNASLASDLLELGQAPMDKPDSSTTIELQQVKKRTEKPALTTEPPKPPTVNKRKSNIPQGDRSLGELAKNSAPKTFKPESKSNKPTRQQTVAVSDNPYAPARYDCNGMWHPAVTIIAIVCLIIAVIEALTGFQAHWQSVVAFVLVAFAMWPLYGWFDELERDMAVKAVAFEYGLTVIRVMGNGGNCDVQYVYGVKPEIREASIDYAQGFAWLKTLDGSQMIGRGNPLA